MNKRQYKRVYPKVKDMSNRALDAATYIVDNEWTTDGTPVTGDLRSSLITSTAISIVVGQKMVKNKYLMQGFILGVGVTIGAGIILQAQAYQKSKNGKHEREE